jgi:hypothetical protein
MGQGHDRMSIAHMRSYVINGLLCRERGARLQYNSGFTGLAQTRAPASVDVAGFGAGARRRVRFTRPGLPRSEANE